VYAAGKTGTFSGTRNRAGANFIRYLERERDADQDGFSSGPYGIIENVRDGWKRRLSALLEGTDEGRDISHERTCST